MRYEILEKEIKMLPESSIAELEDFIIYLKLKEKFSDFENNSTFGRIESKLDEADDEAIKTKRRLTHNEVFTTLRAQIKGGE